MTSKLFRTSKSKVPGKPCLAAAMLILCPVLNAQEPKAEAESRVQRVDDVHRLWSIVIEPMLRQTVGAGQAENVGVTLMVPLHAAFRRRDEAWERAFSEHFARLAASPGTLPEAELSRLYYLYVASRFLVLAKNNGHEDLVPPALPGLLFSEVQTVWRNKPAWQWGRQPFPGGARERVNWKLENRRVEKSYYRAIIDEDLYNFAIAADLKAYGGTPAQQQAWNPVLNDVLSTVRRVFSQEVIYQPGGGWLFQPGVWTDHPEYQYVGNREARRGIKPAPVRGIAEDTSHSLRFPLWLTSFMQAYPTNSEEYRFYENLRRGLENQFFNKVLVQPTADHPCYLTNNFMDGSNGVYRWNYGSFGKENGYGPHQTSGAFLLGWWIFLGTDRVRAVYREAAAEFPWPKQCVELNLGPTPPSGSRPASVFEPESPSNRLWHLITQLASDL